ncbi:MAG TPA: AgmX/PglI C-terminal domain-containing protein [Polyangiaceae bacterium]|nr:AgmX/PglI C-terminal domain-containing protein [Polyangiaceae bacterium]
MTQQTQPSGAPGRPGQMTAVMRAVAATGPKVLRIGLVQSGRVIEERIIKQRTHVTVGSNEKNMFVIAAGNLPPSFRLFELVGNDYQLNFVDGMTGRVALPTGISDLAVLKGQARRTQQGAYQVRLTEDSRGKVVVGDTTFLFQFVAPPPIQPRPQLPVSVTRGATSIDWATTMIAAFSFLIHFSAIGSIYSEWLDPVVDYDVNISNLLDSVRSLPPPPPVEEPTEKPDTAAPDTKAEAPKAQTQASKGPAGKAGAMSSAQAAALSNQLEQMEMATLGALAGAGPATEGVLKTGEVPTGALDKAAASSAGVGVGGLTLGGGGGAIRPGAAGGGLGGLGSSTAGGGSGTGTAAVVQGPKGNASTGAANVSGGTVSNAARVVAGMRAGFRNCYNRALASNPDVEGRISLSIRVGPGGEVQGVSAAPSGNLPDSVVSCVKARAQAAQFDPPQGGLAVIQVPVTFVKQ